MFTLADFAGPRAEKGGKIRFLCEGHDVVDFNYSVLSSFQVLTSAK